METIKNKKYEIGISISVGVAAVVYTYVSRNSVIQKKSSSRKREQAEKEMYSAMLRNGVIFTALTGFAIYFVTRKGNAVETMPFVTAKPKTPNVLSNNSFTKTHSNVYSAEPIYSGPATF